MAAPKNKPTDEESVLLVCGHIREGLSLMDACDKPNTICKSKFYDIIDKDKTEGEGKLMDVYTCAREERQELLFEEIITIADSSTKDKSNPMAVNRDRLRIDARKWNLSRMDPKKYGDKIQTDITTKGESINKISEIEIVRPKND